mgnify:CR=1 FL=1
MQNHGGYGAWDLPDEERIGLDLGWMEDDLESMLTEYLSLISISDRELEDFLGELREIDRPVVVVFLVTISRHPMLTRRSSVRLIPVMWNGTSGRIAPLTSSGQL